MNPTVELLVCVYYRVAQADAEHAIRQVRELQRTLTERFDGLEPQVLLRFAMPPADRSSHASSTPSPSSDDASASAADVRLGVDDTLMETYRLALPPAAGGADPDATVQAFLDALDACAQGLRGLLRGNRHVELFAPCAS